MVHAVRLSRGKADFVKRVHEDGRVEDICLCSWNADFSVRGCVAQVLGGRVDEVVENEGRYAPGNMVNYKREGNLDNRCDYCYASRKNSGVVFPRVVNEKTREDFENLKPEVVRIGKLTECGHPYYFKTLMDFLDLCEEFRTKIIFTTKMFPYGIGGAREAGWEFLRIAENQRVPSGFMLAERLKRVDLSLLYSLGYDSLEQGVVSQGADNLWRLRQSLKYAGDGLNVSATVVCDVTRSVDANSKSGSFIREALEARKKYGLNVRILPIRVNTRAVSLTVTGQDFSLIKDSGHHGTLPLEGIGEDLFEGSRPYKNKGNHEAIADYLHADFKGLIDEGIGVCGGIAGIEYCDKCNLCGDTRISFPDSQLPKIIFDKSGKRIPSEKEREMRKQPKLF